MRGLLAQASMFSGDFLKKEENCKQINVIRSWSTTTTTTTKGFRRPFERARHAHAPPTARRRRVAGALAARDLGAAATPLARRPLAMSHRTGAPLECGGGGGSKVLAVRATPPSPSAGARSTPCTEPLEQRAAHDVFDIPTPPQETTCAVTRGAHVGARARSAPAFGAERVARGSDPAATDARARSAHAIGAELVTLGDAGSQCAAALSSCPTVPPAPVHDWEAPAF